MFDLDRFIAECQTALATSRPAAAVGELTQRAVAAPAAVEAYALANDRCNMDTA
jgi:hypothetical protein